MGDLVQNATYEAAQGFDRAVYDVQNGNAGIAPRSSVLAAVGTSSSWLVALPALLVAANVALVLLLVAALGWALLSLQKERRRAQQHADLAVKLTDAIKAADGAPWFSDFCRYISNATREVRPANDAAPEGRRDAA
jgi:ABC-type transport system involved in cytochrome bd biosynthesis fused ATPase/permease subunit